MSRPYKILVLARNYPNTLLPELGLWVKQLVHHCASPCELKVISPVPYFPPIKGFQKYSRFRSIASHSVEDDVEVFYPRFIVGFGKSLYPAEALSYYMGIRHTADKLHRESAFDLIHAHFTYPDGVVAARLGRRYGIPAITTEHVLWRPTDKLTGHELWKPNWIENQRLVRRQAIWAAKECDSMIAVSNAVKDTIVHFTGQPEKIHIIPIGVDESIFTPAQDGDQINKNQILYVGFINLNKGIDILLKAFKSLLKKRPNTKLIMVGGSFYSNPMIQEKHLRCMAEDLGLNSHIEFAGIKSPAQVAKYMRQSALLVLPSRAESFSAVLIEALACGKPVIATRCGGPLDIVNDDVGALIPIEDPVALANTMEQMLSRLQDYDPAKIRDYAVEKFSWGQVAKKTINLYEELINK